VKAKPHDNTALPATLRRGAASIANAAVTALSSARFRCGVLLRRLRLQCLFDSGVRRGDGAARLGVAAGPYRSSIRSDVQPASRHASVVTLQGYLDRHDIATTKRAIVELVASALTTPTSGMP